ncbi:hypothetical protein FDP41_011084 [Naegleria fowleri]|uniref:Uncharacterized protein n=1 Tax=Naegleria fowleri TaxID=5763 RepID=A0A6A5C5R8_NAEFO|nr:uncharacterized protein FDP41_011659 [Naegleria fowleri]XP_044567819.1 uncharacterized protein FDP41_011084 [Naegleria fowleri]KAF0982254.1 hypothetical protein FDP41_011659 [Naegleria fowleri]KAF0983106.1 hypothetical protein FDP41_011084 [Naegleria fowleri]
MSSTPFNFPSFTTSITNNNEVPQHLEGVRSTSSSSLTTTTQQTLSSVIANTNTTNTTGNHDPPSLSTFSSFIFQTESYEELIREGLLTFPSLSSSSSSSSSPPWFNHTSSPRSSSTYSSPYSPASATTTTCRMTDSPSTPQLASSWHHAQQQQHNQATTTTAHPLDVSLTTTTTCNAMNPPHNTAMNLNNSNYGVSTCVGHSDPPGRNNDSVPMTPSLQHNRLLNQEITNFVTSQTNPPASATSSSSGMVGNGDFSGRSSYSCSNLLLLTDASTTLNNIQSNTNNNNNNNIPMNPLPTHPTKKKKKKARQPLGHLATAQAYSTSAHQQQPSPQQHNQLSSSPQHSLTFTDEYQSFSQGVHETQMKDRKKRLKFTEFNPHQVRR